MALQITPETIKEIADMLDMSMVCYLHKTTGQAEFYPDEDKGYDLDEDMWADVIKKVRANKKDYARIESMTSREAFLIMEDFIEGITHLQTRAKFLNTIAGKKPFAHFNNMLNYYPGLQKEWYGFKEEKYIEYVKEEIKGL